MCFPLVLLTPMLHNVHLYPNISPKQNQHLIDRMVIRSFSMTPGDSKCQEADHNMTEQNGNDFETRIPRLLLLLSTCDFISERRGAGSVRLVNGLTNSSSIKGRDSIGRWMRLSSADVHVVWTVSISLAGGENVRDLDLLVRLSKSVSQFTRIVVIFRSSYNFR